MHQATQYTIQTSGHGITVRHSLGIMQRIASKPFLFFWPMTLCPVTSCSSDRRSVRGETSWRVWKLPGTHGTALKHNIPRTGVWAFRAFFGSLCTPLVNGHHKHQKSPFSVLLINSFRRLRRARDARLPIDIFALAWQSSSKYYMLETSQRLRRPRSWSMRMHNT